MYVFVWRIHAEQYANETSKEKCIKNVFSCYFLVSLFCFHVREKTEYMLSMHEHIHI